MRTDRLYLVDIVDAADAIARFMIDVADADALGVDELRQSAILQKLIVIGEAASRISSTLKEDHPEIEWRDISSFRNIAVHAYFGIDWNIVWATATYDVPALRVQISAVLSEL